MLNWIRDHLYNWLVEAEDEDEDDYPQPIAIRSSREINGPADMHVSVYRCNNGYVVEGMVYDLKNNRHHHEEPKRHRVVILEGTPEQLSEAITLIYVKGHMGIAA